MPCQRLAPHAWLGCAAILVDFIGLGMIAPILPSIVAKQSVGNILTAQPDAMLRYIARRGGIAGVTAAGAGGRRIYCGATRVRGAVGCISQGTRERGPNQVVQSGSRKVSTNLAP